jgi:peptide/nickel transport system permease protein
MPRLDDQKGIANNWSGLVRATWATPQGRLGLVLLLTVFALALGADLLGKHDPVRQPYRELALTGPSWAHPLGVDAVGRDYATRLLYGARQTLKIAGGAMLLSVLLGGFLGAVAGFTGGLLDRLISGLSDFLIGFAPIILGLLIITVIGPSTRGVAVAVGLAGAPMMIRQMRAAYLEQAAQDYVLAARSQGVRAWRIAWRHILPNCLDVLIMLGAVQLGAAILEAAGLSYLGLSGEPDQPEWGLMLKQEQVYLRELPLFSLAPGVAIAWTVLASNLLADGIQQARRRLSRRRGG